MTNVLPLLHGPTVLLGSLFPHTMHDGLFRLFHLQGQGALQPGQIALQACAAVGRPHRICGVWRLNAAVLGPQVQDGPK